MSTPHSPEGVSETDTHRASFKEGQSGTKLAFSYIMYQGLKCKGEVWRGAVPLPIWGGAGAMSAEKVFAIAG